MEYRIVTAVADDIPAVASRLRPWDAFEVHAAAPWVPIEESLRLSRELSYPQSAHTVLIDDEPHALFGAGGWDAGVGFVWMVGSNLIYKHGLTFLRRSPAILAELFEITGEHTFSNNVAAGNRLHTRWLTSLGATWGPPFEYGPLKCQFRNFTLRKEDLHVPSTHGRGRLERPRQLGVSRRT